MVFKKIIEALKDLVTDVNFECSHEGISLQAMDSSHVALVTLFLRADSFQGYTCQQSLNLGVSMANLAKVIKCAENSDVMMLRSGGESS